MWLLVFAAISAPPASVSAPPPRPRAVITNPAWVQKPSDQDMVAAFPPDALEDGVEGKVVLECKVAVDDTLYGCFVVSETPDGKGFGAAGLSVVDKMRMRPKTVNGVAVDGARVRIPLSFAIAQDTFDYTMANALPDAERCVGYAFQLTSDPDQDGMSEAWNNWYTADAFQAGLKPDEAAKRYTASVEAASRAISTAKGSAEANACRDYYRSWKAAEGLDDDSVRVPHIDPPPVAVPAPRPKPSPK